MNQCCHFTASMNSYSDSCFGGFHKDDAMIFGRYLKARLLLGACKFYSEHLEKNNCVGRQKLDKAWLSSSN